MSPKKLDLFTQCDTTYALGYSLFLRAAGRRKKLTRRRVPDLGLVLAPGGNSCRDHFASQLGDLGLIAEAFQPQHCGLAAVPSHLALGVVAMYLLRGGDRFLSRKLAANDLPGLPVPQRVERRDILLFAIALDQRLGLFDQTVIKHL